MDIWKKYKSPLGYETGDNKIDTFGVDHSQFSLRDEIEYQTARAERENQLIQNYNNQGITENYPQYTTNFWGNPENNYGFGSSNISDAISHHPAMNTTPMPIMQMSATSDDYQRAINNYEQANVAGSFMSGIGNSFDGSHTPTWNDDYSNTLTNQQNYTTPNDINKISSASLPQTGVWAQQRRRAVENDMLMNAMDVLYGMNRTVNGMTFGGLDWLGNKLGFDSQMNDYLQLKDAQSRNLAQTAGQIAGYGGSALTGGALANAGYNQANMAYNGYKIGKAYDKLTADPFQGNGRDVIARMRNHNGEPVVLQRGEAIKGPNGEVIVHGKSLGRETGSVQNYGLDKFIYRHRIGRADAQKIPRIIQQKPFESNEFGQNVYLVRNYDGTLRLVTSPVEEGSTVASMYYFK
ncbi:MAG: hypothetical protein J6N49_05175 [Alphaproteobacteria bacterium]|nr:hypothetical protein [Alphaproteobacteria bacterium]